MHPKAAPSRPPDPFSSRDPTSKGYPSCPFPIVGVGASAGGLAAIEAFLSGIPSDPPPGIAWVLVQHLAPDHKSLLVELVTRYTSMPVCEVEDGMLVERDHVYIIPPNRNLALEKGALRLLERAATHGVRMPIDFFFRSLANSEGERAIGVVLSGTGSDGTLGIRAIKGAGGLTIAQEPSSADFDGMPCSAIVSGLVDYVLEPVDMALRLVTYASHTRAALASNDSTRASTNDEVLAKACVVLRDRTGHDFSGYKANTLIRRIERRMALHQLEHPADYLCYLRSDDSEVSALLGDLLIGVTSFFRDPEAFEALRADLLPAILANKKPGDEIRVWVAGCSTGEEAYSLAILIEEHLEQSQKLFDLRIFATDLDARAIVHARRGTFSAAIAEAVSPERLARFFHHDVPSDTYQIRKSIRDQLIFSEHNILQDPPFSKLDLLICRNVLIYMGVALQKRLIPLFHYALKPSGALFLGSSETIGEFSALFEVQDRRWKTYLRAGSDLPHLQLGGMVQSGQSTRVTPRMAARPKRSRGEKGEDLQLLTMRGMLQCDTRVGVLVDARGDILHIYGRTGRYLEPSPGDATMNILTMAREGLRRALTTALHRVVATSQPVDYPGLMIRANGAAVAVNLHVGPVAGDAIQAEALGLALVVLEDVAISEEHSETTAPSDNQAPNDNTFRITELERSLQLKEEYLQATLEELETSNEELRSSNEEMQSVNEELQSANEELETSKEELQSVNEECATVNVELQNKVVDLSRANSDLNNLLASTGVGTLFVDEQMRIARFTPMMTQLINLIPGDVGRPVGDIVSNLESYTTLVADARRVLDDLSTVEAEVKTRAGRWFLMRIRPYRTLENVIEGVVITFVDITGRKQTELAHDARELANGVVGAMREPLLVLDETLRVVMANPKFYAQFNLRSESTLGKLVFEIGDGQWDIPALRDLLERVIPHQADFEGFEVNHDFVTPGSRRISLNARRIPRTETSGELILLVVESVESDSKEAGG